MANKDLICITCPMGCRMTLVEDESLENGFRVLGNKCKRGEQYAIEEAIHPTRMIPTTVVIKHAHLRRLPVRTESPVPKHLIHACMKVINQACVEAPVQMGDIIIENILETGVNIIASRSMKRV